MSEPERQPDPALLDAALSELLILTTKFIADPELVPFVPLLLDAGDQMLSEISRAKRPGAA